MRRGSRARAAQQSRLSPEPASLGNAPFPQDNAGSQQLGRGVRNTHPRPVLVSDCAEPAGKVPVSACGWSAGPSPAQPAALPPREGMGTRGARFGSPVLPLTLQADLFLKNDAFGQLRGTSEGEVSTGGGSRALTRKDPEAACVLVAVMGCPARWPASARVLGKEASSCQSSRPGSRAWERPAHPPSADGGRAPPGIRRGPVPVRPALLDGCWQLTGD